MQLSAEDLQSICNLNPALGKRIIEGLTHHANVNVDAPYVKALFGSQRRFFNDKSKKKAALCSRRAGKTEGVAATLLHAAEDCPGGLSVYISRSRANSRLILWATLSAINERHGLGLNFTQRDNQLFVITPNGHQLWLCGCNTSTDIDKFRGLKLRMAAIDEASSFGGYLRELVEDVLEPALLDLDGELVMISTPGVIPAGYFFEVTTGAGLGPMAAKQWPTHSWVTLQNPYIQLDKLSKEEQKLELLRAEDEDYINPRVEVWLEKKRIANGWDISHPTYLREWCGQWVRDEGALLFPIDAGKNHFFELPEGRWSYSIGVDVGYNDPTAFVVGAQRRGHPEIYIVHAEQHTQLIPSAVAAYIQRLQKRFGAYRVIVDSGGIGLAYVEEMRQRFGIACEAADKRNKRDWIDIVRGECLSGTIKVHPHAAGCLLQELACLVWDEKHEEADDRFEDHLSDAFLYLCRMIGVHYRPVENVYDLSPQEKDVKQMKEAKLAAMKEVQKRLKISMRHGRKKALHDIALGR